MVMVLRLLLAAACTLTLFAHYTWLAPADPAWQPGKTVTLRIGHGHKFPASEEAISVRNLELFVVAPSGARTPIPPKAQSGAVEGAFTVKEPGPHRAAFINDRGIVSRTPNGVRPGGRDKNPNAAQAYRTLRTGVAYLGPAAPAKPLGLEIELTAAFANGVWEVTLLRQGKPVAGTEVEVFLAGAAKAVSAGKTGPDGKVAYKPAGKGAAMFFTEGKDPAPAGSHHDFMNYSTALYVSW